MPIDVSSKLEGAILTSAWELVEEAWPGYGNMFRREADTYDANADLFEPHFFALQKDGGVVGLAVLTNSVMSTDLMTISWLCVASEQQGRGIGKRLLDACRNEARRRKKSIVLTTEAPDFYLNAGFHTAANYGAAKDRYVMFLDTGA